MTVLFDVCGDICDEFHCSDTGFCVLWRRKQWMKVVDSFVASTKSLMNCALAQVKVFLNTEVFGINGPSPEYAGSVILLMMCLFNSVLCNHVLCLLESPADFLKVSMHRSKSLLSVFGESQAGSTKSKAGVKFRVSDTAHAPVSFLLAHSTGDSRDFFVRLELPLQK